MTPPPTDEAMVEAAIAAARGAGPADVPIGAVVFASDGTELARAANAREALGDPTAHAEILALRAAALARGRGWRLEDATWSAERTKSTSPQTSVN